jgi:excisionase family DNA binding protein
LIQELREKVSVTQAAVICGVGRTTVGYWIRAKKLHASREGKKYMIPVQDLLFFLKTSGQKIPEQLEKENLKGPAVRSFQNCWRYFQDNSHGQNCQRCIAFKNKLQVCFSARHNGTLGCLGHCETCSYYQETYYPRLHFIHQFDIPAAVIKDLYFWAGNREMTRLCGIYKKGLIGMGVEQVVHPRSLECVISSARKKVLGDPGTPSEGDIYIKNNQLEQQKVKLSVFLLKEPRGAFLVFAEPESAPARIASGLSYRPVAENSKTPLYF